jgi:hypothetical protein
MTTCPVCGGVLPAQRGPRARRYCSRACQAKAYRARQRQQQEHRIAPGEERELLEAYADVSATELADSLAAAARRLAGALTAGRSTDGLDLDVLARIPVVLAARAQQDSPPAQALRSLPDHHSESPAATTVNGVATAPVPSRQGAGATPGIVT